MSVTSPVRPHARVLVHACWALMAVMLLFWARPAAAQIVTNGSFEANVNVFNNVPGWTAAAGGCGAIARAGGVDSGGGLAPAATDGTRVVEFNTGFATINCTFYQDVAIPAGSTATLAYALGTRAGGPSPGSSVTLRVVPTVGVPIAAYTWNSASGSDPMVERTAVDISAFAGQTVRILLTMDHQALYFATYMDNVRVTATAAGPTPVPTLSEWAMILFGLVLAGGAALMVQRRRFV